MNNKFIYLLVALFAYTVGCSTLQVSEETASKKVDLNRFKTYSFNLITLDGDTINDSSSKNVNHVTNALQKQLELKGLRQTDRDADLQIDVDARIEERIQTRETDIRTDAPRYIGQRRYSWKVDTVEIGRYEMATFEIELIDNVDEEVIWSGTIDGILPSKESKKKKVISEGIERLLENL